MINLLHITFLLLVLATEATAERNYIIGARVDFASGISNRPGLNGTPLTGSTSKSLNTFYAPYPSVEIKTAGEHWNIELSYALGLTRMNTDLNLNSDTHAASARFSRSFKRWKLNLSESFETTPDI